MKDIMYEADIAKCRVDGQITLAQFLKMNPDQCSHLTRIATSLAKSGEECESVQDLLAASGCRSYPPELASMLACFAGDRGLKQEDFGDAFDVNEWLETADRLRRETIEKVEPHVALIAQAIRGADDSEDGDSSDD